MLGMIDFGCVKSVDEKFNKEFSKLHVLLMDKASDEEVASTIRRLRDDRPRRDERDG